MNCGARKVSNMSPEVLGRPSALRADGKRDKIRVSDVTGFFTTKRNIAFFILFFIYALIPFVRINGVPLILFDIKRRHFFLFGQAFNSQDFYLIFFVITGAAFLLFYISALWGRLWCGWACPQTVFLEGLYRPIERWVEGPKSEQLKLTSSPWNFKKIRLFLLKQALYLLATLVTVHIFLSYFIPIEELFEWMKENPKLHWFTFTWMLSLTGAIYLNFVWFREQLCLIVCPYGRLQSILADDDTLIIGYDAHRGEPRGKKGDPNRGSCVNCLRCVTVCPTGIDIREGLQLECIGCANCIDACNDIMRKIGEPEGLIRYDSLNGLLGKKKRFFRPRIFLYSLLLLIGGLVTSFSFLNHSLFEASLLRLSGPPYQIENEKILNRYQLHLINKTTRSISYSLEPQLPDEAEAILPFREITLNGLEGRWIPFFVSLPKNRYKNDFIIKLQVMDQQSQKKLVSDILFLGPNQ